MNESLGLVAALVAIILFFGPIILIFSMLGEVRFMGKDYDLKKRGWLIRILVATAGMVGWLAVYVPLAYLAYRSLNLLSQAPPTPQAAPKVTPEGVSPPTPSVAAARPAVEVPEPATPMPTPEVSLPEVATVAIPAGRFLMGSSYDDFFDFFPAHWVYLDEFGIDEHEATNAEYALCVEARVCSQPAFLGSSSRSHYFDDLEHYGSHPVVFVTWAQAMTYCEWRDARLPTEAQWEKAARWEFQSQKGLLYPWGDEAPDYSRANYDSRDTVRVGSFSEGRSRNGVLDMAGNVFEWVYDFYERSFYEASPDNDPSGPPSSKQGHVARGGAWSSTEDFELWAFRRFYFPSTTTRNDLGFRCAVSR